MSSGLVVAGPDLNTTILQMYLFFFFLVVLHIIYMHPPQCYYYYRYCSLFISAKNGDVIALDVDDVTIL